MTLYIGNNPVIDNYGEIVVGKYATRASLPTVGVTGYMAYVSDQKELVINTSQTAHPNTANSPPSPTTNLNSPDANVTWYKILANPVSNQLSAVLNQGTLAGGYNSSSIWNQITNIKFSTDSSSLMSQTLPWATRYSSAHSTSQYAYYHSGTNSSNGTTNPNTHSTPGYSCKQAWATDAINMVVSATFPSTRPTVNGLQAVTYQSGSVLDPNAQTIGAIQYGGSADYINFTTDTWSTDSRYVPPVYEYYGWAASGSNFSYTTSVNVQKFQWSSKSWTSTGRTAPTTAASYSAGAYSGTRGGMSTNGWNKSYNGWYQYLDKWNESSEVWTALLDGTGTTDGPLSFLEISTITGQNWGYWFGIPYTTTTTTGYGASSRKTIYATDSTYNNPQTRVGIGGWSYGDPPTGNSACGCTGP